MILLAVLQVFDPSLRLQVPVAPERPENVVHAHTVVAEHGGRKHCSDDVYMFWTEDVKVVIKGTGLVYCPIGCSDKLVLDSQDRSWPKRAWEISNPNG